MAVFRVEKTTNYTVMSNVHLRDTTLSLKAKGLLSYMLAQTDDWDYSLRGLASQSKDGIDGIRTAIQELEAHRYLHREKVRDARGRIVDYDYQVFEQPYEEAKNSDASCNSDETTAYSPELDFPKTGKPKTAFPNTVSPKTENPTLLNTKIPNTKEPSTKGLSTIHLSATEKMDENEITQQFEEQLEYDTLKKRLDPALLDELLQQIVEMYCCRSDQQYIGQQIQSTKAVRNRLDTLNAEHIQYIMECLQNNSTPVKNIRAYMRTVILNAPNTIEHYYESQVNCLMNRNRRN
ncbi:MAG: DUF6017 domain-containing protein [Faecalibacterium sp.]|jgi:hypothetical protein|nr:DUF6017 domain-containing protein [Faecalibacterium sp.]